MIVIRMVWRWHFKGGWRYEGRRSAYTRLIQTIAWEFSHLLSPWPCFFLVFRWYDWKAHFFTWHYFHQCNRSCLLLTCILFFAHKASSKTSGEMSSLGHTDCLCPYPLGDLIWPISMLIHRLHVLLTQNRQWTNLLSMHLDGSMMLKLLPESGGRDSGRSYVQSLSSSTRPPAGREDEDVDTIEGRVGYLGFDIFLELLWIRCVEQIVLWSITIIVINYTCYIRVIYQYIDMYIYTYLVYVSLHVWNGYQYWFFWNVFCSQNFYLHVVCWGRPVELEKHHAKWM